MLPWSAWVARCRQALARRRLRGLLKAIDRGHVSRTLSLLGRGADPNGVMNRFDRPTVFPNQTPLSLAVYHGHPEIAASLLLHGAKHDQCIFNLDHHFVTSPGCPWVSPLAIASYRWILFQHPTGRELSEKESLRVQSYEACIKTLVEAGANIDCPSVSRVVSSLGLPTELRGMLEQMNAACRQQEMDHMTAPTDFHRRPTRL